MDTATVETEIGLVRIASTGRVDGDFQVKNPQPDLEARRESIVPTPWTWFEQIHSATVLEVASPGEHSGAAADASYTRGVGCALSVTTADCAPVVLVSSHGFAVIHAGWRGALAGIIQEAATRLLSAGAKPVSAFVGPTIGAGAYKFSKTDLRPLVQRFGTEVVGETFGGQPALNMPRLAAIGCTKAGFQLVNTPGCTSSNDYFSFRTRGEEERMATVAWIDG